MIVPYSRFLQVLSWFSIKIHRWTAFVKGSIRDFCKFWWFSRIERGIPNNVLSSTHSFSFTVSKSFFIGRFACKSNIQCQICKTFSSEFPAVLSGKSFDLGSTPSFFSFFCPPRRDRRSPREIQGTTWVRLENSGGVGLSSAALRAWIWDHNGATILLCRAGLSSNSLAARGFREK